MKDKVEESAQLQQQLRELRHRLDRAEKLVKALPLQDYLEACHSLGLAINVVTGIPLTSQDSTTSPASLIVPRRIIPWDDFSIKQEEIWNLLSAKRCFYSDAIFPSLSQLEYARSVLRPISSEVRLQDFHRDTVEYAVEKLVCEASRLQTNLELQGVVTFESRPNPGQPDDAVSEAVDHTSLGTDGAVATAWARPGRRPRRRARGKGSQADEFYIARAVDGRKVPIVAIEYKMPHKLTRDDVIAGLEGEIWPGRDVIGRDGEGFAFASRALAAAALTQLFSYMVGKGTQYGYLFTGEVFVFVHIPDDPTLVYYSVCVPNLDVRDDGENRLHRTAAAQVFAFVLRALQAEPPPQSWHDTAAALDTWAVEYDVLLGSIPESVRRDKQRRAAPYKPQNWRDFELSPIRTGARCEQPGDGGDRDAEAPPPRPTLDPPSRPDEKAAMSSTGAGSGKEQGQSDGGTGNTPARNGKQYRTGRSAPRAAS